MRLGRSRSKGMGVRSHMESDYTPAYCCQPKQTGKIEHMQTSYAVKVQAIRSKGQQPQVYVNFPLAFAAAIGLEPGDRVQWELLDGGEVHLVRLDMHSASTTRRAGAMRVRPHHNACFWRFWLKFAVYRRW